MSFFNSFVELDIVLNLECGDARVPDQVIVRSGCSGNDMRVISSEATPLGVDDQIVEFKLTVDHTSACGINSDAVLSLTKQ